MVLLLRETRHVVDSRGVVICEMNDANIQAAFRAKILKKARGYLGLVIHLLSNADLVNRWADDA